MKQRIVSHIILLFFFNDRFQIRSTPTVSDKAKQIDDLKERSLLSR